MEQFERNLDAYRIVAEILADLRATVHKGLSQKYGSEWYRTGLNPTLLDRLILRKEREQAIDWYETEYQELMDFAAFPDLLEIIDKDPDVVPYMGKLAPTPPLVHARFMELAVLTEKLALARPLSENELSFLAIFHIRFRKAVAEHKAEGPGAARPAAEPKAKTPSEPLPTVDPKAKAVAPTTPAESEKAVEQPEAAKGKGKEEKSVKPPEKAAAPKGRAGTARKGEKRPFAPEAAAPTVPTSPTALAEAMDRSDHVSILRALYQEVTAIAEGLWANGTPPGAPVWERVTTSSWYSENFSGLGLRPVSDFHELVTQVRTKLQEGATEAEVQSLLKEQQFAQVLLAMRDMFQKNQI